MKAQTQQTIMRCTCGQKHSVPVVLLVREETELERENIELRATILKMRSQLKAIAE